MRCDMGQKVRLDYNSNILLPLCQPTWAGTRYGIAAAGQADTDLSIVFHLSSTRSTCSPRLNLLARLVHLAGFETIIANES